MFDLDRTSVVMQLGVGGGLPPIQQALDHGIWPSISVDVEVCLPGDFFTQMRILMSVQRGCSNERRLNGDGAAPALLSVQEILEFATRFKELRRPAFFSERAL